MMLLCSATDKLQIITGTAVPLEVHATYMTQPTSGDPVPGRKNTNITTATTTDVVASPSSGEYRNLQTLVIRNAHASSSSQVTLRHTDGTDDIDFLSIVLGAGEQYQWLDGVGSQVLTGTGAIKTSQNQGASVIGTGMNMTVLASDVVNNNGTANTIADVTGLSFPVTSGKKYYFNFVFEYTSAATTTGSRWSINGPGGVMRFESRYSLTATSATVNYGLTAHDTPAGANATSAATAGNTGYIRGFYEASSTGSVILRFASEITASAITCKAGSIVEWAEVL